MFTFSLALVSMNPHFRAVAHSSPCRLLMTLCSFKSHLLPATILIGSWRSRRECCLSSSISHIGSVSFLLADYWFRCQSFPCNSLEHRAKLNLWCRRPVRRHQSLDLRRPKGSGILLGRPCRLGRGGRGVHRWYGLRCKSLRSWDRIWDAGLATIQSQRIVARVVVLRSLTHLSTVAVPSEGLWTIFLRWIIN